MEIKTYNNFLTQSQWDYVDNILDLIHWKYGAKSSDDPTADEYFYFNFVDCVFNGRTIQRDYTPDLMKLSEPLAEIWLKVAPLINNRDLARCYANALPAGIEGSLHQDSTNPEHMTAIYYPNREWNPAMCGETLIFSHDLSEIVKAVYPKPNSLLIFPANMPHVARSISRKIVGLRKTLMFKTF